MEIKLIMDMIVTNWLYLCIWFSIILFAIGIVFASISFLMWALIELEGKIRTEKVWRTALKEYLEKRNKILLPKEREDKQ